MIVQAYNFSVWKAEAGDCKFEFEASLVYVLKPYLKKSNSNQNNQAPFPQKAKPCSRNQITYFNLLPVQIV
jgi:hypothetical protein